MQNRKTETKDREVEDHGVLITTMSDRGERTQTLSVFASPGHSVFHGILVASGLSGVQIHLSSERDKELLVHFMEASCFEFSLEF